MQGLSTASLIDPTPEDLAVTPLDRPKPLSSSLVAAAKRITDVNVVRMGSSGKMESWQEDAWDMYDLVGEQRFLSNTIAGRMGQARLFVGKLPEQTTDDVEEQESGPAYDAFQILAGKGRNLKQMITRYGINAFIAGDAYLIGVPDIEAQEAEAERQGGQPHVDGITPFGQPVDASDSDDGQDDGSERFAGIDIENLIWRIYSVSEVKFTADDMLQVKGEGGNVQRYKLDSVVLVRIWREHPRFWWHADSPTRSSLPVLRELTGLTMHTSAQIDSRLAGAGVLLVPESADRALRAAAGLPEEGEEVSPLAEALMEAMIEPIKDRSNASAVVPLVVVVPDDAVEKFKHITFASQLDVGAPNQRNEAIRRLALGEDCPPELLLGTSGMNHWGAWLVREDVVTTHIEPPLALFCDALTTQFLWPVLEDGGMAREEFENYVVWYDVSHLIIRPNRVKDAFALHQVGVISDETLRDEAGFDDADEPDFMSIANGDPVNTLVLNLVRASPQLLAVPGLTVLVEQLQAMADGSDIPMPPGSPIPVEGQAGSDQISQPLPEGQGGKPPEATKPPKKAPQPTEPREPDVPVDGEGDMPDDQSTASAAPQVKVNVQPPAPPTTIGKLPPPTTSTFGGS